MKSMFKKISTALAFTGGLLMPALAIAQNELNRGLDSLRVAFPSFSRLGNARNINELILEIIRMLLTVGGALAVLFIIIGGFMYITAGGNAEQAEKGRNYLVNAVIGVVLIMLSYVIINVVVGTIQRF